MTLDKHTIDGVEPFKSRTCPVTMFEERMRAAGYSDCGSAPTWKGRVKVWWIHQDYRRVEAIYSSDYQTTITAYHVDE